MLSATIEIKKAARYLLKTIFKIVTVLRTDFRGKTSSWTGSVNAEVSDMRGSTVY